jgi:hypothetical protein
MQLQSKNMLKLLNQWMEVSSFLILLSFLDISSEKAGFKCRTYGAWKYNITCQFPAKMNKIYKLSFNTPLSSALQQCSLEKNGEYYSVLIDHFNYNYNYAHKTLTFYLESDNQHDIINIGVYASLIPEPPLTVTVHNITTESASIEWTISREMEEDPILKLIAKVDVCLRDCFYCNEFTNNHTNKNILLDNSILKYVNENYCVKVSLRSAIAPDIKEMWSKYAFTTFKIPSRIPKKSPDVDIGAFFIDEYKNITIYWRELAKEAQNSNDFRYKVQEMNDSKTIQTINTFATFQNLTDKEHKFLIKCTNKEGDSSNSSIIRTPKIEELLRMPSNLTVRRKNNEYYISWNHSDTTIESFTVFWCQSNSAQWCENSFDFQTVKSKNYTSPPKILSNYNFAVSANTKTSSSGMLRSQCLTADSDDIGLLYQISISDVTAHSMTVNWTVECQYRAIVAIYILKYCSCDGRKCNASCKFQNISHEVTNYTVNKLTSFTTYEISMSMVSVSRKEGPLKKHSLITTLESGTYLL